MGSQGAGRPGYGDSVGHRAGYSSGPCQPACSAWHRHRGEGESVLQSEIQTGSHKEYEEVLGEYQDEAYKKIDKKQYSSQANQLIKKYFEQLNE